MSADRGGGIVVGRDAEGRDHLASAKADAHGDDVDPPVPEREPDDVAHGVVLPRLVAVTPGSAPGAVAAGRRASDQRHAIGTASTCPPSPWR